MTVPYDELAYFADNAAEAGLEWPGPRSVARREVPVGGGRQVSALVWGERPPEAVLIHGNAQNAHTWDTVGVALGGLVPAGSFVALDLPGHGHSDWHPDHEYAPGTLAADVAAAAEQLAPSAALLVGMSLGGLTSLALLEAHPDRFERLVLVDITPGVDATKARAIVEFISGPERFASFDELLDRTVRHHPSRTEASLRRGLLHNARELPDGSWAWRWDPERAGGPRDVEGLWDALGGSTVPLTLVRGGASPVVDDADVAEVRRRRPDAEIVVVEGAGHSIQGDRPVELAQILAARWPPARRPGR
jgi:pimeloyl-ACP methyl ester carboxylesterase